MDRRTASRNLEISILYIVGALLGIGIIMVYSSSAFKCMSFADNAYWLRRQLIWAALAIIAMGVTMHIDYRKLCKISPYMLGVCFVLLLALLVPGVAREIGGAKRWFELGPINFQPSEATKLVMIIFVSWYASKYQARLRTFWSGFLPVFAVVGMSCALIFPEPDLGTTIFIFTISVAILVVGGIKIWHLFPPVALALPGVAYLAMTRFEHVRERLAGFMGGGDVLGIGHQVHQSLIALGSGGLFGVGPGNSLQKLYYLPAERTDFILAIAGEELGFLGTSVIVLLFMLLVMQGFKIAKRAKDMGGFLLASGVVFSLGLQAVVNIAVVTGSVPPKGISLPFISFGGSSLVFTMAAVGVLLSVARVTAKEEALEELYGEIEAEKVIDESQSE